MNDNQKRLQHRCIKAAEEALCKNQYVSPMDVFLGMGLLQPIHVDDWRKGKIPYLERVIQGSLNKITFVMKCFRQWAEEKGLKPKITRYHRRTSGPKKELRFSVSRNPTIEKFYRTHYFSSDLSEKKQQKLEEKLETPPDLIVFILVQETQCSKCKKELHKGNMLLMEANQPLCLTCAKLNDLEFLPSGDATVTRRVKKESIRSAIVVRYSRTRKRYERQGILAEKEIIEKHSLLEP